MRPSLTARLCYSVAMPRRHTLWALAVLFSIGCTAERHPTMDGNCAEIDGHPHAFACVPDIQCKLPPECKKPYATASVCCMP